MAINCKCKYRYYFIYNFVLGRGYHETPHHDKAHRAEIHAWVLTEQAGNVEETLNTFNGAN